MRMVFSIVAAVLISIVQSSLLHRIEIQGIIPDLSLIAVIYLANKNGKIAGQTIGFCSGIVEDFLSVSPLGFHAAVKTILGFLYGHTEGSMFVDSLMIPMLMSAIATILKGIIVLLISNLFNISAAQMAIFSWSTLIELGYNTIAAPFVFAFLKLIKVLVPYKQWEER